MQKYKYIDFSDRKQIAARYMSGDRVADIAADLGVSTAAVYRELKRGATFDDCGNAVLDRNQRPAYSPVIAQQRIQENFRRRGRTAAPVEMEVAR